MCEVTLCEVVDELHKALVVEHQPRLAHLHAGTADAIWSYQGLPKECQGLLLK